MGIVLSALAVVATLAAAAVATARLEGWLLTRLAHHPEWGPAAGAVAPGIRLVQRDTWLYTAAPIVSVLGVSWALVTIPFGPDLIAADVTIGLFYYLVVVDFVVLAVAVGGWGANTAHSVEACYRIVAQLVAYIVPLGLAVLGPVMMGRSLSIAALVEAQDNSGLWYVATQPLGFALYAVTALMQAYRAPFLEPFADRIDRGVLGVFGGWQGQLWRTALSGVLFLVSAMGAALFLGGYAGPWLPAPIWMLLKTFALMAFLIWAGRRVRPRSTAEMLALGWKVLIPVGLLNVLLVGGLILLGVGQSAMGSGR